MRNMKLIAQRKVFFLGTLLFHLIYSSALLQAASVRGRIIDQNNAPLPFASIYIKGTTTGTTSNQDGYYSIDVIKFPSELVFQMVGYKVKYETLQEGVSPISLATCSTSET